MHVGLRNLLVRHIRVLGVLLLLSPVEHLALLGCASYLVVVAFWVYYSRGLWGLRRTYSWNVLLNLADYLILVHVEWVQTLKTKLIQ
jgi:hypothetical protein